MPAASCGVEEIFRRVAGSLPSGWPARREFRGVSAEALPFFCALLTRETSERLWVISGGPRERDELAREAALWMPGAEALPPGPLSGEGVLPDPEISAGRLRLLLRLAEPAYRGPVVVERAQLGERVPRPGALRASSLAIAAGQRLAPGELVRRLEEAGYERAPQTSSRGEYTVRGGLLDVFALQAAEPLRVEWEDEVIASLRVFDPDTQVSTGSVREAEISLGALEKEDCPLPGLMAEGRVVCVDPRDGDPPGTGVFLDGAEGPPGLFPPPFGELHAGDLVLDGRRAAAFFAQLREWRRDGWLVALASASEGERARFREFAREHGEDAGWLAELDLGLSQGFLAPAARVAVLADAALFGRAAALRLARAAGRARRAGARAAPDFSEFAEGDQVVHLEHGIGIFRGVRSAPDGGAEEVLVLEYAGGALLYVPLEQAWQVSRYAGLGRARPALSELGSEAWRRARERAVRSVFDYAGRMLRVQAERQALEGHAFQPDTHWQKEFEDSFPWRETPDQLRAIAETKADMESPRPMDRLVCGDVGFGKTEVAIRAAFKAVMGGRQVIFLAPTTVLARQHYHTLRERLGDYPLTVELLTRFRTPGEQRRVIEGLASGAVDIVAGTHRLISPDVVFRNPGLVVVDEEQRFGVRQKEALKERFRQVDILTLSATPIPRTLYLALAGARDLSLIETPPPNRQPVETIVCAFDERVWRAAIEAELARGGQVYFLHNRVRTIERVAARVRELCPGARVVVGHGQMTEAQLEPVMEAFVAGRADVLVSTTIIESGLDIPNANTIIIDRADLFGLADLYQLRGRVGRSGVKARAYLMLPRDLMGAARRRVSAIKQYSELGSGFKIAMRDLELRGAGNLLGTAQSGHIMAVGFDLYCKLLKQAVETLKTGRRFQRLECAVRLDFVARWGDRQPGMAAASLPASYVADARARIACHRQLAEAETEAAVEAVEAEWKDRFGPLPPPARNLVLLARLARLGARRGLAAIESREGRLLLQRRKGGYVQPGGRFPRLEAADADSRLREVVSLVEKLAHP